MARPTPASTPGFEIAWNIFLALVFGAVALGITGICLPGLLQIGGYVSCPAGTRTVALVEHQLGSGRKAGHDYTLWCLDAEGVGARRSAAAAWWVLYGLEAGGAGLVLGGVRLRDRARRRRAEPREEAA